MKNIMFLGESGVGKTSYISYLIHKRQYREQHLPTPGVQIGIKDFSFKQRTIKQNNKEMQQKQYSIIQLWDTAGKHKFHEEVCTKFYKQIDAFIIMIDISNRQSLEKIQYWKKSIKSYKKSEKCPIGIIANKSDLDNQIKSSQIPRDIYYRQISLKNKEDQQQLSQAQLAIKEFIQKQIYKGEDLPTAIVRNGDQNSNFSCNCLIM